MREHGSSSGLREGTHYVFGAVQSKQDAGLTQLSQLQPGMCEVLVSIARAQCPYATFTTVALCVGANGLPHDRRTKPETLMHWVPLNDSESAHLWTELLPGSVITGQPAVMKKGEQQSLGQLHAPKQVVSFPPHHRCALRLQDEGEQRIALLLSTQVSRMEVTKKDWQSLQVMGFAVSPRSSEGGDHPKVISPKRQHSHGTQQ